MPNAVTPSSWRILRKPGPLPRASSEAIAHPSPFTTSSIRRTLQARDGKRARIAGRNTAVFCYRPPRRGAVSMGKDPPPYATVPDHVIGLPPPRVLLRLLALVFGAAAFL